MGIKFLWVGLVNHVYLMDDNGVEKYDTILLNMKEYDDIKSGDKWSKDFNMRLEKNVGRDIVFRHFIFSNHGFTKSIQLAPYKLMIPEKQKVEITSFQTNGRRIRSKLGIYVHATNSGYYNGSAGVVCEAPIDVCDLDDAL